jgi:hypothetical protein
MKLMFLTTIYVVSLPFEPAQMSIVFYLSPSCDPYMKRPMIHIEP